MKAKVHSKAEKAALRRKKKSGGAAMRRKERRLHLQPKPVVEEPEAAVVGEPHAQ